MGGGPIRRISFSVMRSPRALLNQPWKQDFAPPVRVSRIVKDDTGAKNVSENLVFETPLKAGLAADAIPDCLCY